MIGGGALSDLALLSGEVPEVGERRSSRDRDMVPVLDKAPLYAGVQVKNPLAFAATLTALRGFIQTAAPGLLEWGDGGIYRDVPITRVGAKTSNFDLGHDADLVYAIPAGVFRVSFERGALDLLIDQVLDGTQVRLPKEGDAKTSPVQADFRVATGADDALKKLGYLVMEGEAVRQWQVAHRDEEEDMGHSPEHHRIMSEVESLLREWVMERGWTDLVAERERTENERERSLRAALEAELVALRASNAQNRQGG